MIVKRAPERLYSRDIKYVCVPCYNGVQLEPIGFTRVSRDQYPFKTVCVDRNVGYFRNNALFTVKTSVDAIWYSKKIIGLHKLERISRGTAMKPNLNWSQSDNTWYIDEPYLNWPLSYTTWYS